MKARGSKYGAFIDHARIVQNLKTAMRDSPNWNRLPPDQTECLEMVAHKIGRILNGDHNHHDSWHDIEGYVHLVTQRIEEDENNRTGTEVSRRDP